VVTALRIVNFVRIGLFLQTPLTPSPCVLISACSAVPCGLRCAAIHYFFPQIPPVFFYCLDTFHFHEPDPEVRFCTACSSPSLSLSIPSHSSSQSQMCSCARMAVAHGPLHIHEATTSSVVSLSRQADPSYIITILPTRASQLLLRLAL